VKNESENLVLREATLEDEQFLFEVYASTRQDELAGLGWDDSQKRDFLKMQFLARQRSYPRVNDRIIILDGLPIGRMLIDRNDEEILLKDIALLTEYRNRGLGTILIHELMDEASVSGKAIRLHVLATSAAVRLYERLGFSRTGFEAAYLEMKWSPSASN